MRACDAFGLPRMRLLTLAKVVLTGAAAADAKVAAALQEVAGTVVERKHGAGADSRPFDDCVSDAASSSNSCISNSDNNSSSSSSTALQELRALADALPSLASSKVASSASMDDLD
jgi:hypothetical protein